MEQKKYTCSRCGLSHATTFKEIETVFGWRNMGDVQRPQSQCRKCRNDKIKVAKIRKAMKKASGSYEKAMRSILRTRK